MLIEQIVEFELRGPGLYNCACTSTTGYFYEKNKNVEGKSSSSLLFPAKMLHKAMYLTFPYLDRIT